MLPYNFSLRICRIEARNWYKVIMNFAKSGHTRHPALVLFSIVMTISLASADILFTKGTLLQDLPGAKLIAPTKAVPKVGLSLVPARVVGQVGASTILNFTGMCYQNSFDNKAYLFGPTLRLSAGQKIQFDLTNDLGYPAGVNEYAPGT